MKKLYIGSMILIFILSIAILLRFGVKPRPIEIMKASTFSTPEEIGALIYRRFYVDIESSKLAAIGLNPGQPFTNQILDGFLAEAKAQGHPFDFVVKEPILPALGDAGEATVLPLSLNQFDMGEVSEKVKEALNGGKRVLIYTVNVYSSHLIDENPLKRFENKFGTPVFSISMMNVPIRFEEESKIDPPCIGAAIDTQRTASLGCAALKKGRSIYRKQLTNDKYVALMEKLGGHDYILYLHGPS